jgi:hypothetical protein
MSYEEVLIANGTIQVKGERALNISWVHSKTKPTGDDDSSPAFKFYKFQTNSTDPKFITNTRTDETFRSRRRKGKIKFLKHKIFLEFFSEDNMRWFGVVGAE